MSTYGYGCNGSGDPTPDGGWDHCCYIDGQVCQFLTYEGNLPRCSLFDQWGALRDNPEWVDAPVGQFFAVFYPSFDCGDWPQNIPNVKGGLCCYGSTSNS